MDTRLHCMVLPLKGKKREENKHFLNLKSFQEVCKFSLCFGCHCTFRLQSYKKNVKNISLHS